MKKIYFLFTLLLSSQMSLVAKTKIVDQSWHNDTNAQVMSYKGPKPLDHIVLHTDAEQATRHAVDVFSQEDHSTYDPVNNTTPVYTNVSMEDYYAKMMGAGGGGQVSPQGYVTFTNKVRTYVAPGSPSLDQAQGRPINIADINPDATSTADLYSHYSIKATAGLIFRDQFDCQTNYEHLKYDPNDQSEVRDGDGKTSTVNDSNYCFFIYIPQVKDSTGEYGPWWGRVHPDDVDSQKYIKDGLAPYLPVKQDADPNKNVKGRLQAVSGPFDPGGPVYYGNGRYMVPMKQGHISLPQNGFNLLYNRYTVNRTYQHDRQKIKTTKSKGWLFLVVAIIVAVVVTVVTFGAGAALGVALVVGVAAGGVAGALLYDPASSSEFSGAGSGTKAKWSNPYGGSYLNLPPASEVDPALGLTIKSPDQKYFPPLYNTMDNDTEKSFLCSAMGAISGSPFCNGAQSLSLPIAVNSDRTDIPVIGDVEQALTRGGIGRMYQLAYLTDYNMTSGGSSAGGDPTNANGNPPLNCPATGDAGVDALCAAYDQLFKDLDGWKTNHGAVGNSPQQLQTAMFNAMDPSQVAPNETVQVAGRNFPNPPARKQLADIYKNHQQLIDDMANKYPGDPTMKSFVDNTDTGSMIAKDLAYLEAANKTLDPAYADLYFSNPREDTVFKGKVEPDAKACKDAWNFNPANDAQLHTCLKTKLTPTIAEYHAIDDHFITGGPFQYYNEYDATGEQVLGGLSYMEDYVHGNNSSKKYYSEFFDPAWKCPEMPVLTSFAPCALPKFQTPPAGVPNLDSRYDEQ